ncbi:MAG TPA: hypothetical protein VF322_16050 [Gammaproteobacteria bacterium]
MEFLLWLERSAPGVWLRESPSLLAFPTVLFLHTLGLALLVGVNAALDLWVLKYRVRVAPATLTRLAQLMWLGFGINAVSGAWLLLAYPAKALTNPVFYAKLALIAFAMVAFDRIRPHVVAVSPAVEAGVGPPARTLAVVSLGFWAAAILAGRLLAYTHSVLMAEEMLR